VSSTGNYLACPTFALSATTTAFVVVASRVSDCAAGHFAIAAIGDSMTMARGHAEVRTSRLADLLAKRLADAAGPRGGLHGASQENRSCSTTPAQRAAAVSIANVLCSDRVTHVIVM